MTMNELDEDDCAEILQALRESLSEKFTGMPLNNQTRIMITDYIAECLNNMVTNGIDFGKIDDYDISINPNTGGIVVNKKAPVLLAY